MASSALPLSEVKRWRLPSIERWAAIVLIVAVALLQAELAVTKSINWDEFFHYAEINAALQGRSVSLLQTPYVRLFSWVPALPGSEIDHIRLIRLLFLPFEAAVAASLFLIIRKEIDRETAACGALAYVTGGYVFLHALALRSDTIAAALLMVALALASLRAPKPWVLGAIAILTALATLSTIKSVFYFPVIGVTLWLKLETRPRRVLAVVAAIAVVACAIFLLVSPALMAQWFGPGARETQAMLREAGVRMFPGKLLPQPSYLKWQMESAPILAGIIVWGAYCAARAPGLRKLLELSRFIPLLGVAFYFNAYPYHYAFIMPPAVIASAPAIQAIVRRYGSISVGPVLFLNAAILSLHQDRGVIRRQEDVISGVHLIFPQPVTYIDDVGIVAFPRAVNRFTSGWGLADYRSQGGPVYLRAAEAEPVPLLIDDGGALDFLPGHRIAEKDSLLPADRAFVSENYLPHWGKVFVAGKRIPAGQSALELPIVIPGLYTLESSPAEIDGLHHGVGDVVRLDRGAHTIAGPRAGETLLRWGDHLPRPAAQWPQQPLFTDF